MHSLSTTDLFLYTKVPNTKNFPFVYYIIQFCFSLISCIFHRFRSLLNGIGFANILLGRFFATKYVMWLRNNGSEIGQVFLDKSLNDIGQVKMGNQFSSSLLVSIWKCCVKHMRSDDVVTWTNTWWPILIARSVHVSDNGWSGKDYESHCRLSGII